MSSSTKPTIGTIISGTSDNQLIAKAFLEEIKRHDTQLYWQYSQDFKEIEDFSLEMGQSLVVDLMDALDAYAPAEYVFSSHPYDPLNYGFWSVDIFQGAK